MKISQSSLTLSAQYNQQVTRQSRQQVSAASSPAQADNRTAQAIVAHNAERVALNSRHATSVASWSTNGQSAHQSQWYQQSQFDRFYVKARSLKAVTQSSAFETDRSRYSRNDYALYQSAQQLTVSLSGSVITDLGETITFHYSMTGNQNFSLEYGRGEYAEQVSSRKDPLIVNYSGGFNHLSAEAFAFDLDADGSREMISFAGEGSAFLALDRNNDGIINDGSELFGAGSGDGFKDLAQFDEDGNGFIDAGDSIYQSLKLYSKNSQGHDVIVGLEAQGIAAIGLENTATPFRISNHFNQELGMARSAGLFITNDGQVGSVQQVDLTVRNIASEQQVSYAFSRVSDEEPTPESEQQTSDLDNLLTQLKMAKQDRLDRQQQLTNDEQEDPPKTLLEQLVDTLEDYTEAQTK